jgi:hypothetical protein
MKCNYANLLPIFFRVLQSGKQGGLSPKNNVDPVFPIPIFGKRLEYYCFQGKSVWKVDFLGVKKRWFSVVGGF